VSDPLSVGLAIGAAAVAGALGWVHWPRPPALDGERWFKLALATTLRGRADARGVDAAGWEAEVVRFVPYHPAGREPERKVLHPEAVALPGVALPGERELLAALATIPDLPARWARLYDVDRAERLADPAELGPAYDFGRWLHIDRRPEETGWDVLAAWEDGRFASAIGLALPARWVAVGGRRRPGVPTLVPALCEALPRLEQIPWAGVGETAAALAAALATDERPLVLVGEEAGITAILRTLLEDPELRDRVLAVVSVGGVVGGDPAESEGPLTPAACADWLGANFAHHALDTERVRFTPYFSLGWLDRSADPPGAGGLPVGAMRFPPVRQDAGVVPTLETVDLGLLPADPALPLDLVARALVAVVAAWARSRA
jgi:hypothetical protein